MEVSVYWHAAYTLGTPPLPTTPNHTQSCTHYTQVIRWFWEIADSFPLDKKKRLLFFVTGSDRVPIKGLANLSPQFTIARNGPNSRRLPTAHTCFNHLLLPQYKVCDGWVC